jgi:two-component system response regulator RegX3
VFTTAPYGLGRRRRLGRETGLGVTGSSLLVVDDDEEGLRAFTEGLQRMGFHVQPARSVEEARSVLAETPVELVLLAATVGGRSSLLFCAWLRQNHDLPILVTGTPGIGPDVVELLDAGADGYLSRPVREHEASARIRAVLRRPTPPSPGRLAVPTARSLVAGDIRVDAETRTVAVRGTTTRMPKKEFELLWLLMASAGHVVRRETLVERVWGKHLSRSAKTLDVHIGRVREKVEDDPTRPTRVVTVRGVGFRYEPVADPSDRAVIDLRDLATIDLRGAADLPTAFTGHPELAPSERLGATAVTNRGPR